MESAVCHLLLAACITIAAVQAQIGPPASPEQRPSGQRPGQRPSGQRPQLDHPSAPGSERRPPVYPIVLPPAPPQNGSIPMCPMLNCDSQRCPLGFITDTRGCASCECLCHPVRCRMHCMNGWARDPISNCEVCRCKEQHEVFVSTTIPCPPIDCIEPCPYGAHMDSDGCMTCRCLPPPLQPTVLPQCPEIECLHNRCPFGYLQDDNGCMTCRCVVNGQCPATFNCSLNCQKYGYKTNSFACPQCECAEETCPQKMCGKICEHGFARDENGCQMCECERCPQMMCTLFCEYGFTQDDNGCHICECSQPTPTCSPIMCLMECAHGFEKDENGCDLCSCVETKPICLPMTCMFCESGYKKDDNGCHICECVENNHRPTCPPLECSMDCEYGVKTDASGCFMCECAERMPTCSPISCRMFCEYGFQQDENGCDVCTCKLPPSSCPMNTCQISCVGSRYKKDANGCDLCECEDPTPACPLIACLMFCPSGFAKDNNGCNKCECNPSDPSPSCQPVPCRMLCADGFKRNENGCEICECADPKPTCPPIHECKMECTHGFKKDRSGCHICECAADVNVGTRSSTCVPCQRHCPYGFMVDMDGCDICTSCEGNPICASVMCAGEPCTKGLVRTRFGCDTCECQPEICPASSTELCDTKCLYGYTKDDNGCNTCFCEPVPDCPPMACYMECPFGFRRDSNNCVTCECLAPISCPLLHCLLHCPNRYKLDVNGCTMCQCEAEPRCHRSQCLMFCPDGFKQDSNGCDLCQCNDLPTGCPLVTCPPCATTFKVDANGCQTCECKEQLSICQEIVCMKYCRHGLLKDEHGCNICECRSESECAELECGDCDNGYVINEWGCSTCECTPSLELTSPCDAQQCRLQCAFGFRTTVNGCRLCECREHVCEGVVCYEPGTKCVDEPVHCIMAPCPVQPVCVPEPDFEVCAQPPRTGRCRASIPRFYYNTQTSTCEQFMYGGCGANDNNFLTVEDCERTCDVAKSTCSLKTDSGPCYASMPRWFHNTTSGLCEMFIYGGCAGNGNNFLTKDHCQVTCSSGSGEAKPLGITFRMSYNKETNDLESEHFKREVHAYIARLLRVGPRQIRDLQVIHLSHVKEIVVQFVLIPSEMMTLRRSMVGLGEQLRRRSFGLTLGAQTFVPRPESLVIGPARRVQGETLRETKDENWARPEGGVRGSRGRQAERPEPRWPDYIIAIMALTGTAVVLSCFTFVIVLFLCGKIKKDDSDPKKSSFKYEPQVIISKEKDMLA